MYDLLKKWTQQSLRRSEWQCEAVKWHNILSVIITREVWASVPAFLRLSTGGADQSHQKQAETLTAIPRALATILDLTRKSQSGEFCFRARKVLIKTRPRL
jgi:hypothetical protein